MSLINLFISAAEAIAERQRRERAYAELMALDDHSLADIGVNRSEIRALVEGGRGREAAPLKEEASYWAAHTRLIDWPS